MSEFVSKLASRQVNLKKCILTAPQLSKRSELNENFDKIRDLRPYIKQLNIYESLTEMGLTGEIILQDSTNLSTLVPLMGTESVNLEFSIINPRNGQEIEYKPLRFRVYEQTNRMLIDTTKETYRLGLMSPERLTAHEKRISKTYRDVKIENVIRDILTSSLYLSSERSLEIHPTTTPTTITIPYLTIFDAIKLFTIMGVSQQEETSYFFYETLEGFNFLSLQQMIRKAKEIPQSQRPHIARIYTGVRSAKDNDLLLGAESIDIISGFDFEYNLRQGYFASVTLGVDVLSGRIRQTQSKSDDSRYANKTRLNDLPIYPKELAQFANPTAKIFMVPSLSFSATNQVLLQKDPSIRDNYIEKTLDGRNRELLELQTRTVRVVMPGAPGINVGKIVYIEIPDIRNANKLVLSNRDVYSANYLIIQVKHSIINRGVGDFTYETEFEASTDSVKS